MSPYRTVDASPGLPPRARGLVVVALAALAGLAGMLVGTCEPLDRELSSLSEPERRGLYERTRETLRTACAASTGPALAEHCRAQADLLRRFPECDAECRALVARFSPRPSR